MTRERLLSRNELFLAMAVAMFIQIGFSIHIGPGQPREDTDYLKIALNLVNHNQ